MKNKLTQAVAIVLAVVGLVLVPASMLELVRWGAIAAIIVFAGWSYFERQNPGIPANLEGTPLSAVLMVSVTASIGRVFDEREWELFRGAIMQCVRGSDYVSRLGPGLYSVTLRNVDAETAEIIGQRISEQLQNLIVFDDLGAIKKISVGIGGVVSFAGSIEEGQRIAADNLKKLQNLNDVNVLMSLAA